MFGAVQAWSQDPIESGIADQLVGKPVEEARRRRESQRHGDLLRHDIRVTMPPHTVCYDGLAATGFFTELFDPLRRRRVPTHPHPNQPATSSSELSPRARTTTVPRLLPRRAPRRKRPTRGHHHLLRPRNVRPLRTPPASVIASSRNRHASCWSPSHDHLGISRPSGTSSAELWYLDIAPLVAQAK